MTGHPLCALFDVKAGDIEELRRRFGLGSADEPSLHEIRQALRPRLDAATDAFLAYLSSFKPLDIWLRHPGRADQITQALRQYLAELGRFADPLDYAEERLSLAVDHEALDLRHHWLLTGSTVLFGIIAQLLAAAEDERGRLSSHLRTLQRTLAFDTAIILETAHRAADQRAQRILQELAAAQEKLREVSRTDGLTGVFNRRYLEGLLSRELDRSRRFGHPFSLLFVDVDHFKQLNDRLGHAFGDEVLIRTADVIRRLLRQADVIGRYGGEEFVIGLSEASAGVAGQVAERIRRAVEAIELTHEGERVPVTISVGVATLSDPATDLKALLVVADRELYRAKAEGRNRVCSTPALPQGCGLDPEGEPPDRAPGC